MQFQTNNFKNKCCICSELISGQFPDKYQYYYPIKNRICLENKHFIVVPSISPIVEGHLLIIPKYHIKNLASTKSYNLDRFFEIMDKTIAKLLPLNKEFFFFEHGVGHDGYLGCGIDHAHLHIIPIKSDLSNIIINKISSVYNNNSNNNLKKVLSNADINNSYLLFGNDITRAHYVISSQIPSQYIRKMVSNELGENVSDWKKYTGKEKFLNTYKKISENYSRTA